ncbi:glucose-6-phosphate isomerase cytosolic [Prunus yedoensis var. nudiflora]|uniref:Glucose-6-phosphate isomerase cytosolic n=1 Tax=Prunus yedoensis var. nudiflora TaxID=2094558 RepID=A0A314ZJJ2_PRUYE|nr:glucose-6-phosphate isomerase cytosolic [Prunus yedoensis var. nudiflora]
MAFFFFKFLFSWQVGATGKVLKDVIAVGIGGSFLCPLQTDPEVIETARGRQLHFGIVLEGGMHSSSCKLDPIDVARNIAGLNPETTLVVVVLKTFTTAETVLNVRTLREWISSSLRSACLSLFLMIERNNFRPDAVAKHMEW